MMNHPGVDQPKSGGDPQSARYLADDPQALPSMDVVVAVRRLRGARRWMFSMVIAVMAAYLLIAVVALGARDLMGFRVFGSINIGIILALGQFGAMVWLVRLYVRYAKMSLDPVRKQLEDDFKWRCERSGRVDCDARPHIY
jgi:uncharacterized membrane protein (DUF485 family)